MILVVLYLSVWMFLTIIPLIYCIVRDNFYCPLWYIHEQVDGQYQHRDVKYDSWKYLMCRQCDSDDCH